MAKEFNLCKNSLRSFNQVSLAVILSIATLSGCASITQVTHTNEERAVKSYEISITKQAIIPGDVQAVFTFIAAEDVLPKVLTGYGPLPAVVRTSAHTGPWDKPGSARVIHLKDGSTLREQITQYEPTHHFAYQIWDFGHPVLRALATGARGDWTFAPMHDGTHVTWTYTFTAKNALSALPLSGLARLLWSGYMQVCLDNSVRLMRQTNVQPKAS